MKNNPNENLKFFLYARKSSESEDRQVQSIEDQTSRLTDLSKACSLEVKETLVEAKSAKKPFNRPVFDDMLERIEKGEANAILCWQINRLSRNPIDSGKISWMLQQGIIKCIQTIDRKYLPDDNVLLFNVETGMANQFIIDLRKNSWRGMEGKADRGWLPSMPPLGYINDKIEHTIIEDPYRYQLVRRMWDLMLTGSYTPNKIRLIANKEWGFRTRTFKRKVGDELSNSTIYKLFTNIFYTGMFEWAGRLYNGKHTPMITTEEFDRVQAILGKNGKPRAKTREFAYTGIITCGHCGGMVTASEKEKYVKKTGEIKKYVYYHCTRTKKGAQTCGYRPIGLEELEKQIDNYLLRYTILPEFRQWALDILKTQNDAEIADRNKIYDMQHQTLINTQKELDNLTRMRYKELIDDETFIKERDILQVQITRLKQQLHQTEDRTQTWLDLTEKTFHFVTYARQAFIHGTLQEKREIFSALGQNFSLKGKILSIEAFEWFTHIEKAYPELEAEFKRIELNKSLTKEGRNAAFASLITRWGAIVEEVRIALRAINNPLLYIPELLPKETLANAPPETSLPEILNLPR